MRRFTSLYFGKLHAARYFIRWELPATLAPFDLLERGVEDTPLSMQDAWF